MPVVHSAPSATPLVSAQLRARMALVTACLCFFALGTAMSALGPALPELATRTGRGLEDLGGIFSAIFFGALIAQILAGPLSDRADQRLVLLAGVALFALGTFGYATSRTLPLVLAGALVAGLGQGALVIVCNILIVRAFAGRSTAALNLINIFFGVGDMAGPALAVPALWLLGSVTPVLGMGAALALIPAALVPLLPAVARPQPGPAQPARSTSVYRAPLVWALGTLLLVYVGTEISVAGWTATYIQQTTTLGAGAAALVTAGFWMAVTIGRVLGALLSARLAPDRLLQLFLGGALAGGLLLALGIGSPPLTIAAVLLLGLCFGPIYPTVVALAANSFSQAPGSAVSIVASMGSLGGMLLPWLQGVLLARSGPAASTLLVVAGTLAMLALHTGRSLYGRAARRALNLE